MPLADQLIFYDKMKILAQHLHHIIEYAQIRGIRAEELMAVIRRGATYAGEEVEADDFYRVLAAVDSQLNDELLGIRLGNFLNLKALGLIYQISLQASTVQEALFYLKEYIDSTLPLVKVQFSVTQETAVIELAAGNENEHLNRIVMENVLTVVSRELALMTTSNASIILFSPYYASNYPDQWEMGKTFSVRFSPVVLNASLDRHRFSDYDVLIPEYLKVIESFRSDHSFSSKVRIAALSLCKPELPGLETIASSFHLTPRTLQRRLISESTTFREVTNDLKKQLANLLVRHQRFSVTDISNVLGYSEPAAFIHSFKKWFGVSLEKMRRSGVA